MQNAFFQMMIIAKTSKSKEFWRFVIFSFPHKFVFDKTETQSIQIFYELEYELPIHNY